MGRVRRESDYEAAMRALAGVPDLATEGDSDAPARANL